MAVTLTEAGGRRRASRRGVVPLAVGLLMILVWVVTALGADWIAPYPPADIDFLAISQPPSPAHWFGTDQLGRDILSRVIHGGTYVLTIAPAATLLGLGLGAAIGLATAWFGSWFDEAVMRVLDAVMAFPIVILAMLALTFLGAGTGNVVLVIGLVFAPLIARTVRAAALVEARKEYVMAAQLRGEGSLHIMAMELLPNVRGPLIVEGTVRLGYAVFTSATLGFLGLGVQPPTPDWGLMVSENQALLTTAPWTVLFPALAIAWVVVAIGLAADGLKEYLEP
ncbi:peptide ABC transporter permease [Skermanella stibiiresistens SB22]|uniref:Peptide ABC transporter permease n=1 Tax=Skermanella stibiiresistens SB22 TaxID=1385369 RepID=W9H6A8_9PROT|nr:ABC transporter permease [Skermanella stibiiresistens]EWY41760.1 peptide ABC transporter permease [Skermanella stibiiresistens SB22]